MSKEKQIWDIVSYILGNYGEEVDGISIHESEKAENGELHRKIYTHHMNIVEDGCVYYFCEPWDEFNEAGIEKAIEILKGVV